MRLVDIDSLKGCAIIRPTSSEEIAHIQACSGLISHKEIPTAYDVEAVVAELEVEKERHEKYRTYWSEHSWKDSLMYNECDMSDRKVECFETAISIVRGEE